MRKTIEMMATGEDMNDIKIYFSDYFFVDEETIADYGAVNISLINDLPLFIDPFLLFNSKDEELRRIHDEMISYLRFLQMQSEGEEYVNNGKLKAWYLFSEVKQTWLGFSLDGNAGRGLGPYFARGLYDGLIYIMPPACAHRAPGGIAPDFR